ncbi:cytochrome c biogenesis protein ResB [Actinopolymorpha alba]|uniref:cytochrome c biogenesis protein ResB n=1 Tax=Actinopolymorpha alba TaxID=533267 RepID=UPI00039DDABE|nr:cytochrome c biogenesis protein ResB [Actinopolymorpha alba]
MTQTQERTRASGAPNPPALGPLELARWAWRQLTSMRTALLLLFLLALASVPGSIIPQRQVNPVVVADFIRANPELSKWYDRFGLFDVFSTPWFAAIYLLLLVSLLGCILPRAAQHWQVMRARPPAAPRHLNRMPGHRSWTTDASPAEALAAAKEQLMARRYRVVVDQPTDESAGGSASGSSGGASVAAERGYLREIGNLLFHVAIVVVLVGVAIGSLFGFRGTALVVVGNGFANTITQYDGYQSGALFTDKQLPPFALTVKKFMVKFETQGEARGSAREFGATLDVTAEPGAPVREYDLRVNHPLQVDGAEVHLIGHGYAPRFTVRDGNGEVAFSGPVPFLPQDAMFSSTGVVKVPDARPKQLGFQGFFLPTAIIDQRRGPTSAFPDAVRPAVFLTGYQGDLGLDNGAPQSVYRLDQTRLTQFRASDGQPWRLQLTPGQSARLPDGAGSITFDGYTRWVNLQISRNPGAPIALVGAVCALGGLLLSLVVRRRRIWVRVTEADGRTVVAIAGLDKSDPALAPRVVGQAERSAREAGAERDATTRTGETDLTAEIDRITADLPGSAATVGEEHL